MIILDVFCHSEMGAYIVYVLPAVGLSITSKIFGKKTTRTGICIIFHLKSETLLSAPYSKLVI